MEINVNTDNTIDRHQGLDERVRKPWNRRSAASASKSAASMST
jgi:hypothetical protein